MNKTNDKLLAKQKNQEEILKAYVKVLKNNNMYPTRANLSELGISHDRTRRAFGTLEGLRKVAREKYPEAFKGIVDDNNFTQEKIDEIYTKVKKYKKFVITSAVNGARVDKKFYKTLKQYCKKNDALLIILPSYDKEGNVDRYKQWHFDGLLANDVILFSELYLNHNIRLVPLKINATTINPTAGLHRLGQGKGSFIFPSPKQFLEYVAVSNQDYPHALMTTGAITVPNYTQVEFIKNKASTLADYDHVMGAVVVEITNMKEFHFRQIQADKEGGFADLGIYYKGTKNKKMIPEVIFGDWHAGETDPVAKATWIKLIKQTGAKNGYFHDLFSGASISHHEKDKKILRSRKYNEQNLSLEKEINDTVKELSDMKEHLKKMYIVRSNHDEFLTRYLEDGRYINEPYNYRMASELAMVMLNGADPLRYIIEKLSVKEVVKSLVWFERDQDHRVGGVLVSAHGDRGPNGSFGSRPAFDKSYGEAIIGHSHSAGIFRRIYQVGTTSKLKLDYNVGPSSWAHTSALLYPNGQVQLINAINGRFTSEEK